MKNYSIDTQMTEWCSLLLDGVCEVYSYEALSPSQGPYVITFYAYNPDNPELRSEEFTLTVEVSDFTCFVEFVETAYDALVLQSTLNETIHVVAVDVTSNCDVDDVRFEIVQQTYQAGKMIASESIKEKYVLLHHHIIHVKNLPV